MRRPWSARAKRRLIRAGVLLTVILGVTALVVFLPKPHREAETFRNVPVDVSAPTPENVAASPKLRNLLISETDEFVRTAVRRHDLAASWHLIHPNLKQGLTKKQWLTGDIPVVPFPAKGIIAWDLDWSYSGDVAADVVLQPVAKSGLYRKTFTIEFKRVGSASENQWLVYSWVPSGVSQALIDDEHAAGVAAALENVQGHQGLSPIWILVPVGIIAAVFTLPLVLFLVERRRSRRAVAAHQAALAARYGADPDS
jgi:hypothetical protein